MILSRDLFLSYCDSYPGLVIINFYFLHRHDGFYIKFDIFTDNIGQFINIFIGIVNEKASISQIKASVELVEIIW